MPAADGKNADGLARSQPVAWRFPVCAPCAQHAARWKSAEPLARWVRIGGLGIALLFLIAIGGLGTLLIGVVVPFGLAAVAKVMRRREARTQCHAGCASPGPPVIYLGSLDTVDSFEFMQKGYAADFMRANLSKLAAQPHETQSFIQPDLDRVAAAEAERKAQERERVRAAEAERKALEHERARIAAEVAHDNDVYDKAIARMDVAKGPAGRKGALEAGLRSLRQEHMRERLMLEASRVEVSAAFTKAEGLKSTAAKLKTLSEALETVRNDSIPDRLQLDLIRSLEAAIAQIEDEENSIDMA